MVEQLTIYDLAAEIPIEEENPVDALFEPNGRERCKQCRRPFTAWGGRLYCLQGGCSGGVRQ